ncbi:hypothetical protein ACL02T_29825 [Pseudonocardia sp. RS010]|uniref:hypothetical protein n=1 Tax=Pseudonocardia sp. RS010 TaxID=3385979 RepID=UPI00399FEFF3
MEIRTQNGSRVSAVQAEGLIREDERRALATPGVVRDELPELRAVRVALSLLPAGHPVAPVARQSCREFGHQTLHTDAVACGRCWEHAIRADERVVVEFGLTAKDERPDPGYIDVVAVERVIEGEYLPLGSNERDEVIRRMRAQGCGPWTISDRLGESTRTVRQRIDELTGRVQGSQTQLGAAEAAQVA